jgi:hypothetical protein
VARHRDEPIAEVLDTRIAMDLQPELEVPALVTLAFDAVTHEHDLCHAIGVAGDRDSVSVRVGSERACERMASVLDAAGAPSVQLTTEDGEERVGTGPSTVRLSTTRYTLMRLVAARMRRAQADAMEWDGDAATVLDALVADGFFTLQPRDVIEAETTESEGTREAARLLVRHAPCLQW